MAQDSAVNTEKYIGPGKAGQAFAVGTTWGVVGLAAGSVTGLVGIGKALKDTLAKAVNGAPTTGLKGSTLLKVASLMAPVAFLIGGVRGWMQAGKMRHQFETLQVERTEAQMRAEVAEAKLETVSSALQETQTKFTDMHRSQAHHGSMAAHHSKAEHGSHADAVRASQHEASEVERTH